MLFNFFWRIYLFIFQNMKYDNIYYRYRTIYEKTLEVFQDNSNLIVMVFWFFPKRHPIPKGTFLSIIKHPGYSKEEFFEKVKIKG